MAEPTIVTLGMEGADIAVLTFNDPNKGANVLSRGVLAELESQLDKLEKQEAAPTAKRRKKK